MSVFKDMARDAGTHIDAGIGLDEAAAWHEAQYREELERAESEEAERAQGIVDPDGEGVHPGGPRHYR